MLGRWIGHRPRGRLAHENITAVAPVRGERLVGPSAGGHDAAGSMPNGAGRRERLPPARHIGWFRLRLLCRQALTGDLQGHVVVLLEGLQRLGGQILDLLVLALPGLALIH